MKLSRRKILAWTAPTLATVALPVHAQTSNPTANSVTFNANGVFIVPEGVTEITAIVNGGGGGFGIQGGLLGTIVAIYDGGAGEQLTQTFVVNPGESYTVTIGQGGFGYTGSIAPSGQGGVGYSNGQDSTNGGGGGGSSHFNGIEASGGAGGNIPSGRGGGPNGGVAGTNGGQAGNGLGAPGQVYDEAGSNPRSDGSVIIQWTV